MFDLFVILIIKLHNSKIVDSVNQIKIVTRVTKFTTYLDMQFYLTVISHQRHILLNNKSNRIMKL